MGCGFSVKILPNNVIPDNTTDVVKTLIISSSKKSLSDVNISTNTKEHQPRPPSRHKTDPKILQGQTRPGHRKIHTKAFTRNFSRTLLPRILKKRGSGELGEEEENHFDKNNQTPSQLGRMPGLQPLNIPEASGSISLVHAKENPTQVSRQNHNHMDDVITVEQIQSEPRNVVITSSVKTKVIDLVTSHKWAPIKDNLNLLLSPLLSSPSKDDTPKRDKGYRSTDERGDNRENDLTDSPESAKGQRRTLGRRGVYKLKRSSSISKKMRNMAEIASNCIGTIGGNVYLNRSSVINKDHHIHSIGWRNAMDCVRDAVIVTDEKGIVLFYNKRCVTMLEVYHENIMDKNVNSILGRRIIKPVFQSRRSTNNNIFINNTSNINEPMAMSHLNNEEQTRKITHNRTKSHAVDDVIHGNEDKNKIVEIKHRTPQNTLKILSVMSEFYDSMYFLTLVDVTSEKQLMMKYAIEAEKNNQLIKTLLPPSIIERIKNGEHKISDRHNHVAIGFCDVVGFTTLVASTDPDKLFDTISSLFAELDLIAERIGVYKVETAGDNYMMACGLFGETDYVNKAIRFMSEVIVTVKKYDLNVRTGINAGSVVSGVVGTIRPQLRIMGDTVNTASRMESHGQTGKIHVSQSFIDSIDNENRETYQIIKNEPMQIKGKGIMQTYFISIR